MGRSAKPQTPEKTTRLFLTCEHAGNKIPRQYKSLFINSRAVLQTHRGWDPGAFEIAHELQKLSGAPFYFTKLSRLVVDMNRAMTSETLLSKWTMSLDKKERRKILSQFYIPYRSSIKNAVEKSLMKNRIAHFGIHSFSPYIESSRRGCHIGVLYDPKSRFETEIANRLFESLKIVFPKLGIRMNYPYRGDADGLTSDLRNKFRRSPSRSSERYAGLEIEFNQAFLRKIAKQNSLRSFARLFHFALESALSTASQTR